MMAIMTEPYQIARIIVAMIFISMVCSKYARVRLMAQRTFLPNSKTS